MEDLKPCPFCGSECEVESYEFGDCKPKMAYRISCKEAGHSLDCWDDSEEEAATTWNTRDESAYNRGLNDGRRDGFVEYAKKVWHSATPKWLTDAAIWGDDSYNRLIAESEAEASRRWPEEKP